MNSQHIKLVEAGRSDVQPPYLDGIPTIWCMDVSNKTFRAISRHDSNGMWAVVEYVMQDQLSTFAEANIHPQGCRASMRVVLETATDRGISKKSATRQLGRLKEAGLIDFVDTEEPSSVLLTIQKSHFRGNTQGGTTDGR